jgi:hypothetical protein
MVMDIGWRIVPIIFKNVLLFFGGRLRFLICRVLFDTRQSHCRVSEKSTRQKPFTDKIFAECLRHSAKNASRVVNVGGEH